jgi:hypothetical protein
VFEGDGRHVGLIDITGAIFGMATSIDDELLVLERNSRQLCRLALRD